MNDTDYLSIKFKTNLKNSNILKITIGIPAYNEEKNIASIITKLKKITNSIIVCDDGSSDMTSEISKNLGVVVISHKKIWVMVQQ